MNKNEYDRLLETLTPLEGLSLNLNLLKHRCQSTPRTLTPEQRADIARIIKNIERTITLVTDAIRGILHDSNKCNIEQKKRDITNNQRTELETTSRALSFIQELIENHKRDLARQVAGLNEMPTQKKKRK